MAIAYYYVDPGGGDDVTGDGLSDGTAWATVQHALDNITQGTDGDQINIKAGTSDSLAATLDTSTYGTPAVNKPLVFRGYTSTANDGGQGEIDGAGSYSIFGTKKQAVTFADLKLGSCGSSNVLELDSYCQVILCEITDTTGNGINAGAAISRGAICGNNIYDIAGVGINCGGILYGTPIADNYLANGSSNDFTTAIKLASGSHYGVVQRNIISVDSTTVGIDNASFLSSVDGNSLLSSGTGNGIVLTNYAMCTNNIVEGFNTGFVLNAIEHHLLAGNAAYNNTTDYDADFVSTMTSFFSDNETLSGTAFDKTGSDTFANRMTYFAPKDEGNVRGGAFCNPSMAKGAVMPAAGGGGGGLLRVGMQGGFAS